MRVSDTQGQWFGSSLWVRATGPCKNESMGLVSLIIADTFISWTWYMIWFWRVDKPALNKWVQGPRGWDFHSGNGTIKWWSVQISGRMNCEWWQMGFSGDDNGEVFICLVWNCHTSNFPEDGWVHRNANKDINPALGVLF